MKTKSTVVALAVAALIGGVSASKAADAPMYEKMPMAAPVVAPAWSWTGPYVGVFAGYAWGDVDMTEPYNPTFGFYYNGTSAPWTIDADGFFGGATAGYNWQSQNFVFGVEGELGYMGIDDSKIDPNSVALSNGDTRSDFSGDFYGALTGRLGFTAGRALFYVKGGGAFINADASVVDTCSVAPCGGGVLRVDGSETMFGWTVGGGAEVALGGGWTAKAEYMYFDFGSMDLDGVDGVPLNYYSSADVTAHTVKVGLNYKF